MRAIRVCERVRFLWHTAARIHRCHRPIRTGRSTERTLENCNRDDTTRNETTRTNETRHDTTRSDEATKQRSLFADAIREIKSQLCSRCESADRDDSECYRVRKVDRRRIGSSRYAPPSPTYFLVTGNCLKTRPIPWRSFKENRPSFLWLLFTGFEINARSTPHRSFGELRNYSVMRHNC